ncbi:MAG: hypothetical protein R3236_07935 [Phycisphaeraceae bacterium]|nr:hypothetical protein [Phycisphaeraceae bacterium]
MIRHRIRQTPSIRGRAGIKILAAVVVLGGAAIGGVVYVDMPASTRPEARAKNKPAGSASSKPDPAENDPDSQENQSRP